ncbi:30S ribosomal protein S4, chloroplastic [Frankliniella fusca]|uniref:30S ribosomal protein S4, chloroplastic n=1 Tax=Frankliniella fusca TaxID=407009 RepID=A0AAE1GZ04_9NEOP|nr:30S ribosomal protein S4, chloroplastic [Frankliniella fusca]
MKRRVSLLLPEKQGFVQLSVQSGVRNRMRRVPRQLLCYVWDQTEARKGSAEITSMVWSFIQMKVAAGIEEFRIHSDNCSAQNKNQFLFSMYVMASIRFNIKITHCYLEVGHTHMEVRVVRRLSWNSRTNPPKMSYLELKLSYFCKIT